MNTKILKLIQLLTIVTFLFISCAERPIYRLKSLDKSIPFYKSKEVVSRNKNNIETILHFDDITPDNYIFYVEILNSKDRLVRVRPEKIYMEIFTNSNNINYNTRGFHNKSVNPEFVLKSLEEERESRDGSHDVSTGLNLLGTVFSIVADIASDSDNKTENVVEDIFIGVDNQIYEEADYEDDIHEINSEKQFWKTEVLRRTTLYPDESIGGLVFFPNFEGAKIVKVCIPVGRTTHTYLFEQVRIN